MPSRLAQACKARLARIFDSNTYGRPRRRKLKQRRSEPDYRQHANVELLEDRIVLESDTIGGAPSIGQNQTINAEIGNNSYNANDVDIWRVSLSAGQRITINVEGGRSTSSISGNLDPYLRLFNSSGSQVGANDDGGTGLNSRLTYDVPSSGSYYIGVSSFNNRSYNPNSAGSGSGGNSEGDFRLTTSTIAAPSVRINNVSVSEGNTATFTVTQSRSSGVTTSVRYRTVSNTAGTSDYVSETGTVTFSPGQTSRTITIGTREDSIDEPSESFYVDLYSPSRVTIADSRGVGTITDDDPTARVFINNVNVSEGNTATFTLTKDRASSFTTRVRYATASGSAGTGDYVPESGTVTFSPNQTSRTITIATREDTLDEFNETFFVNLSNSSGMSIGDSQGQGTILDDDVPNVTINNVSVGEGGVATFTVVKDRPSPFSTSLNFNTSPGSAGTADFVPTSGVLTFAPNQTSRTISVQTQQDNIDENTESFSVLLSPRSGLNIVDRQGVASIIDNDPPAVVSISDASVTEGGIAVFNLTKDRASGFPTTVSFTTSPASASPSDFSSASGSVTFAPGQTSRQVAIQTTQDGIDEPTEFFFVRLTGSGGMGIGRSEGRGTIVDDDSTPVAEANGPYVIDEGDGLTLSAAGSTDADGDSLTYRWDVDGDGDYDENVTGASPTLSSSQMAALGLNDGPDTRTVTVEASDGFNTDTDTSTLSINNVAPELSSGAVDLNAWSQEDLTSGAGNWTVSGGGDTVFQSINGNPTVFHSDFNIFGEDIQGTIQVQETGGDDDFIGFVLGFSPGDFSNSSADYLLVDWKQGTQNGGSDFGIGPAGLAVSRITGVPVAGDFWSHSNGVNELQRGATLGSTGWVDNAVNEFTFEYDANQLNVFVNGTLELSLAAPSGNPFPNGRIGFYNFSQSNVQYSTFSIDSVVGVEGTPVTVSKDFTDVGLADTHTATIDWGDGTVTAGTVTGTPGGSGTVTGNHTYADNGEYTVTITVTDDDGGSDSDTLTATIANADPVLTSLDLSDTSITEGGDVIVSGSFTDPGTADTHDVVIDWGDGTTSVAVVTQGSGSGTFTATRPYLDDGPSPGNNTASDNYTITATVTDDDGGSDSASATLTVNNVAPSLDNIAVTSPIDENGTATLTADIIDPGTQDEFTLVVDWGDGSPQQTVTVPAGSTSFSVDHQYLDDNPTATSSDVYDVTIVSFTDDDGGTAGVSLGGNIFLTGHDILSHGNQNGFSVVAMDYLRGAGLPGEIARTDYDIGLVTSFATSGFDPRDGQTFGNYTNFVLTNSVTSAQFTAFLNSVDVMVIPEYNLQNSAKLNTFGAEVEAFFNAGGDIFVDSNNNNNQHYGFLPPGVAAGGPGIGGSSGFAPTQAGLNIGITNNMVNGFPTHNIFTTFSSAFTVLEVRSSDQTALTLGAQNVTISTGGGIGSALGVTVNNVAPVAGGLTLSSSSIDENGTVTVTGSFTDVGTQDTHTVMIDWGDGTSSAATVTQGSGSGTFTASHTYDDDNPTATLADNYTIAATVTDDDGGSDSASTTLTVNNVAPVAGGLTLSSSSIDENGTVTVTGSFTDVGTQDTHTVEINWGDGTTSAATVTQGSGSGTFTATHQYLDDGPSPGNGTASDNYTITATVTDDDGGSDSASATVTVNNVAPSLENVTLTPVIDENGVATLEGDIVDPGTKDAFTLTVDWGDGSAPETFAYAAGTTSFSETHQYLDDNPTATPSDSYSVGITVLDDDEGSDSFGGNTAATIFGFSGEFGTGDFNNGETQVFAPVTNVTQVSFNTNGFAHTHGQTLTIYVELHDPDTNQWAQVYTNTFNGTFSFSGLTLTIPEQSVDQIRLRSVPGVNATYHGWNGASVTLSGNALPITVNNVAPVIESFNAPVIDEDGTATITGTFSDVGTLDTHTVTIDWGDGTSSAATVDPVNRTFTADHQYLDDDPTGTPSDVYSIGIAIEDDDKGTDSASTTVTVNNLAPVIESVSSAVIDENDTATITGSFSDVGTLDTHTVTIDWGDGTSSAAIVDPVNRTFTADHQYLDDDPTGTPSDTYPITVTVTDDDGGSDTDGGGAAGTMEFSTSAHPPSYTEAGMTVSLEPGDHMHIHSTHLLGHSGSASPYTFSLAAGGTFTLDSLDLLSGSGVTTITSSSGASMTLPTNSSVNLPSTGWSGISWFKIDTTGSFSVDTVRFNGGATVTVNNVAPEIESFNAPVINEDGTATIAGTFSDVGTLDTHTVTIDWGDGTSSAATVDPVNRTFTADHQYLDDDPTGTPSDVYNIGIAIEDDDTGTDSASTTVTVNNVAPEIESFNAPVINEEGTATIAGTFSDVGTLDTHTVTIDWGDGTSSAATVDPVNRTFTADHQYLDDDPTGTPSDVYNIGIAIEDDDTGTGSASTTVTVNNVAPTLVLDPVVAIDENGVATLTGTITDPGTLDTFTLDINWGDPLSPDNTETYTFGASSTGSQTFTLTHQYLDDNPTSTSSDTYTISATVTDDDTGTGSDTETVVVNNVAPTVVLDPVVAIDENGVATLTGTITDPGTLDTFTLDINWGDPLSPNDTETYTFGASATGSQTFTLTHQYLDDNPTSTGSDTYTISATVTDDDTGTGSDTETVVVNNVAPTLVLDPVVAIDENGVATLTGTITDPGTLDTFTLDINWGDPLSPNDTETYTFGASATGSQTFTLTHQYLDDNPTSTGSDTYTISATVTDDDTGTGSGTETVVVNNVAPTLVLDPVVAIDENGVATLTGTITDPGTLDTFTLDINWGDPLSPNDTETYTFGASSTGSQTFTLTHQYLDDNPSSTSSDTYAISATVTDDDTGTGSDTEAVTVNNVAPVFTSLTNPAEDCGHGAEGEPITIDLTFDDVGTLDEHTVVIDWGDGNVTTEVLAVGARSASISHTYAAGGVYYIDVDLSDDDTGADAISTLAVISGVSIQQVNGENVLQIIGTDADDHVSVNQTGNGTLKVHWDFLGDDPRNFSLADVDRIMGMMCEGDDHVTVSGRVDLPTIISGDGGNDHINGGGGSNILLGGDGDDHLNGGPGRDILIGGLGADRLVGGPGADIMTGGVHTTGGSEGLLANYDALLETQERWQGDIDDILAGDADPEDDAVLAAFYAAIGDDNGAADKLTGSSSRDWILLFGGDAWTDENSNGKGKKK